MNRRIVYERGGRQPVRRPIPYGRQTLTLPPREQRLQLMGLAGPFEPAEATSLLAAICGTGATLALQILATDVGAEVALCCKTWQLPEIERAIRGATSRWEVTPSRVPERPSGSLCTVSCLGPLGRPDWVPSIDAATLGEADPLAAILEAVQPLREDELLDVRYRVRPASPARSQLAQKALTQPIPPAHLGQLVGMLVGAGPRGPRFEPRLQRALEERLDEPAFELVGEVALSGNDLARLKSRARSLSAAFATRFNPADMGLSLGEWRWCPPALGMSMFWPDGEISLYVTAGEVAALWHPASDQILVPGISHLRRPLFPVSLAVEKASGLLLGVHLQRGKEVLVHLPFFDLEAGSMAIFGKTGVGKTTLLYHILRGLILAPGRRGIGLIDPPGDLALEVAACSIPPEREEDVVLVELQDTDFPVRLPIFVHSSEVPAEIAVQNNFSVLRLVFQQSWSATRMEDAVFALASTISEMPKATLLDVPRLLSNSIFRRQALAGLNDPVTREFWQDYEQMSEAAQREVARPVLYRLRTLYRAKSVRNLLCQASGPNFLGLNQSRIIALISLSGEKTQSEADLIGELVIARLHLAAQTRLSLPREERRPFHLAVDEAQRFQGASLPILLSEGRKLGMSLILSTQFVENLGQVLSEAVLGNIGTLATFRSGPTDSRRLAGSLRPFTPDQIEDLDRYEAVIKLQINGATMPAFDIKTLPVETPPDEEVLARIRENTRRMYARPRREVEAEIERSFASPPGSWNRIDVDED